MHQMRQTVAWFQNKMWQSNHKVVMFRYHDTSSCWRWLTHISWVRGERRTQTCQNQLYVSWNQKLKNQEVSGLFCCHDLLFTTFRFLSQAVCSSEEAYFEETFPLIRSWEQVSKSMSCQFAAVTFAICCIKNLFLDKWHYLWKVAHT